MKTTTAPASPSIPVAAYAAEADNLADEERARDIEANRQGAPYDSADDEHRHGHYLASSGSLG